MRRLIKISGMILLTLAVIIIIILVYAQITFYEPDEHTTMFQCDHPSILSDTTTVSLMTWNLGYAGMGDDMDFFYDGGRQVRTSRERTLCNLRAILEFIREHQETDVFLFQEADQKSRRSYYINMPDSIKKHLPEANHTFGLNYHVRFVPVPWYAPMGRVSSGLVTSSRHIPRSVKRLSYPGHYPWPGKLFNLQRCFLLSRYPLTSGKELVIINTHNSAFDDGDLRARQMEYLRELIVSEYERGNYVIAGGDFNQCPPGFEPGFYFNIFDQNNVMYIKDDYLEGWHYVYDHTTPTNRRAHVPYHPATTPTTLIDFFIVSPNVKPLEVQGIHLDFEHSDHNPVVARFRLLGPYSRPAEPYSASKDI